MKKIKTYFIPFSIALISMLYFSCRKNNNSPGAHEIQGTLSLEVHVVHHSWDLSGIMVYLERNAVEFPGKDSTIYDYKGQADGYGKITFEHLYPGDYYLYASGYDATWGSNVIGYMPVILDNTHTTDNLSKVTLLVSE